METQRLLTWNPAQHKKGARSRYRSWAYSWILLIVAVLQPRFYNYFSRFCNMSERSTLQRQNTFTYKPLCRIQKTGPTLLVPKQLGYQLTFWCQVQHEGSQNEDSSVQDLAWLLLTVLCAQNSQDQFQLYNHPFQQITVIMSSRHHKAYKSAKNVNLGSIWQVRQVVYTALKTV